MPTHGNLYIISAPSGGGKTSLVNALVSSLTDITVSISHTTRAARQGETDGTHYHFIDEPTFHKMIAQGKFLEYATIFGNLYGTCREWVQKTLNQGTDVILEIDWQGAQEIRRLFPHCISIFIVPPSPEILAKRLQDRQQDDSNTVKRRLADVRETFFHLPEYDYIVLNDDFTKAVNDLQAIVITGRLTRRQQLEKLGDLLMQFTNQGNTVK